MTSAAEARAALKVALAKIEPARTARDEAQGAAKRAESVVQQAEAELVRVRAAAEEAKRSHGRELVQAIKRAVGSALAFSPASREALAAVTVAEADLEAKQMARAALADELAAAEQALKHANDTARGCAKAVRRHEVAELTADIDTTFRHFLEQAAHRLSLDLQSDRWWALVYHHVSQATEVASPGGDFAACFPRVGGGLHLDYGRRAQSYVERLLRDPDATFDAEERKRQAAA
jgi:hypothetical protein